MWDLIFLNELRKDLLIFMFFSSRQWKNMLEKTPLRSKNLQKDLFLSPPCIMEYTVIENRIQAFQNKQQQKNS